MSVINIKDSIPQVYIEESRDFQLFVNLLQCIQNGIKFDIDKIVDIVTTRNISSNYINLLKSKLGYNTTLNITNNKLRIILEAFPYIIKRKGSKDGIVGCVNCYLKLSEINASTKVDIDNSSYTVSIGIEKNNIDNINILKDILSYVIPTGYLLDIYFYTSSGIDNTQSIFDSSKMFSITSSDNSARSARIVTGDNAESKNRTYNSVQIVSAGNIDEGESTN